MGRLTGWVLALLFLCLSGCSHHPSDIHAAAAPGASRAVSKPAHAGGTEVLRIATFNIRHGRGHDGTVDLQRTAGVVTASRAHIVFLNEVDRHWPRSGNEDQTARLADLTAMPHAYFAPALELVPFLGKYTPQYGNAVLSSVPWSEIDVIPLPRRGGLEPRNMIRVRITITQRGRENSTLTVIGTHLSTDRTERRRQIEFILESVPSSGEPTLLIGDFNSPPERQDMQALFDAGWIDVWAVHGSNDGSTFPSHAPRHRIDYILASPEAAQSVRRIEVVETLASDHFPVVVELDTGAL